MKVGTGTVFNSSIGLFVVFFFFSCANFSGREVRAQDDRNEEQSEKYSREELAGMLAPVALYPDALLSQVLMASTYPIEIIEADRWVRKNPALKGDALDEALVEQDWATSVKAVCHFPEVLAIMSERIGETTEIGNAFLAQEEEVMEMVQELRAKAHAEGHLETTSHQKVIVQKETIVIEPVNPAVIYVPYYDPYHVYGAWWYPAYPPYYWRPHGSFVGYGVSYWPAYHFGFSFGYWSRIDWHRRYVYIDAHKAPKFVGHDRWKQKSGRWRHSAEHRRGVAYRSNYKHGGYGYHRGNGKKVGRDYPGGSEWGGRDRDHRYDGDRKSGDRKNRRGNDDKGGDKDRRYGNEHKGGDGDRRYGVENNGRGREKAGKSERYERDARGRGGDRDSVEKYSREKPGTGTESVRDRGRGLGRVETDKGDGGKAYERFGKVRTGGESNIGEAGGRGRRTPGGIGGEGVGRTGRETKSTGVADQPRREGGEPGRPGGEKSSERFDGGKRGGSQGDSGSTGTLNRKDGFQGGGERGRTGTGGWNKDFRGEGDRGGGPRGYYRSGGDRGGDSAGNRRGGGRSFENRSFENR